MANFPDPPSLADLLAGTDQPLLFIPRGPSISPCQTGIEQFEIENRSLGRIGVGAETGKQQHQRDKGCNSHDRASLAIHGVAIRISSVNV